MLAMSVISKIKDPRLSYIEVLKLKMSMQHELLQEWLQCSGLETCANAALVWDLFGTCFARPEEAVFLPW